MDGIQFALSHLTAGGAAFRCRQLQPIVRRCTPEELQCSSRPCRPSSLSRAGAHHSVQVSPNRGSCQPGSWKSLSRRRSTSDVSCRSPDTSTKLPVLRDRLPPHALETFTSSHAQRLTRLARDDLRPLLFKERPTYHPETPDFVSLSHGFSPVVSAGTSPCAGIRTGHPHPSFTGLRHRTASTVIDNSAWLDSTPLGTPFGARDESRR